MGSHRKRIHRDVSRSAQGGLVLPAYAISLAVAVILSALLIGVANRAGERAQAQAAADAVALAGAAEGRRAAVVIAEANNVVLERFEADGNSVTVAISLDGVQALAAAQKQIRPAP